MSYESLITFLLRCYVLIEMGYILQRADEEAARLYEEFVESFKADDVPGGKAFVRGGTINPDAKQPISETVPPSKF